MHANITEVYTVSFRPGIPQLVAPCGIHTFVELGHLFVGECGVSSIRARQYAHRALGDRGTGRLRFRSSSVLGPSGFDSTRGIPNRSFVTLAGKDRGVWIPC